MKTVNNRFKIGLNEDSAIVSHYLHNEATSFAAPFIERAYEILGWEVESSIVSESRHSQYLFPELFSIPFPASDNSKSTFIDLFAGIGGFRIALQNLGGKCVYSSEWDLQAQKTYLTNFGEVPFGDITKESTKQFIPNNFDVLCAGFPCHAFLLIA